MVTYIRKNYRKLVPIAILAAVTAIAGGTDLLSAAFHREVNGALSGYLHGLRPFIASLLIGALFFSIARLLYEPLQGVVLRAVNRTSASERGKTMVRRTFQLGYWLLVMFFSISLVAPELLGKLFLGVSILTAAMTLALQGVAKDFVSGLFLQFSRKFSCGDYISVIGVDVKGKITDIGYLSTYIETPDGLVAFPNGEFWTKPVRHITPESLNPPLPPAAPPIDKGGC